MRKHIFLFVFGTALLLGATSCAEPPKPPAVAAPPMEYKPVATVKDIMDAMVDPAADELWDSVKTVIDIEGTHEFFPKTDDEWKKVRGYALTLVEAPNLLMMPRTVAQDGDKSQAPGIELEPREIQALIDGDRATFRELALCLQATALEALKAIDMKDKEQLNLVSGNIDHACERCHQKYWYPADAKGREAPIPEACGGKPESKTAEETKSEKK